MNESNNNPQLTSVALPQSLGRPDINSEAGHQKTGNQPDQG